MSYSALNFGRLQEQIDEYWSPKIIAQMNDYHFKLAKVLGEFVWHSHSDTDEAFIVLDGTLTIEFRDGQVTLEKGEMFVVPKGIEHRPIAKTKCQLLLIEPAGTVNTGSSGGKLTTDDDWLSLSKSYQENLRVC
jgi:mannose-6-phosphate isomerase-like protein (cupin superfamily)